ncbi:MAG TPA: hypothetical protein VJ892_00900 [Candidatus Absconditabacterales bacterium]|nr:hypothetical protein [Candidatus Absconditabacterales bacterium]
MKKLLTTIIGMGLASTMLCCQSENESIRDFEQEEPKQIEYQCLMSVSSLGNLMKVIKLDYGIDKVNEYRGVRTPRSRHDFHCFDKNTHTIDEMIDLVEEKYKK